MRGSEAPHGEWAGVEEYNEAPESGGRRHGHHSGLKMSANVQKALEQRRWFSLSQSRPGIPEKQPHFRGVSCSDVLTSSFIFTW